MKVIGAGFSRTGTLSLRLALELLGVGSCVHPLENWPGEAFGDGPRQTDGAVNWREALASTDAAVGWLGARYYRELMAAWPDALVVLSVREPEAWYASYTNCLGAIREIALAGGDRLIAAESAASQALMVSDGSIWKGIVDGSLAEREPALERFERHNTDVASSVRADRLLVYDVAQGWEPLCDFLGLPAPESPFPHLNALASFRERLGIPTLAPASTGALSDIGVPATGLGTETAELARPAAQPHMTGLAVTQPETSLAQDEVLALLGMKGDPFAERVFRRCGVRRRNLGLTPAMLDSPLQGRTSQTEDQLYEHAVRAVDQLGLDPRDIGTVVTSSLFSLGGPTLAHRLVEHYGMDPATDKYHVLGVGCASAVPLFRLAATSLADHPGKKGLVVAADSMSGLMTRAAPGDPRAKVVGSSLWGDGCAAAVLEIGPGAPGPTIVASTVHHLGRTLDHVRMELSDDDSYLHLNLDLPDVAAAGLADLVGDFLRPLGLTSFAIDHWIVHPGGRRIIECIQAALDLSDAQVGISYEVLANRGNVGTPSIFYVLNETLEQRRPAQGHRGLLVTVGPGVTVGLMLLLW